MSTVYNLEPPSKGKVLLHTSLGDLDIELWPKEAPKAVRNFVQLCQEGYYDGSIFHRIIKDYMAQGGDPTGTGEGGESIYGDLFKDEFHQRLKFSRRGLVACANQNQPHTNGSQFFITLDKCEWLDKKNTIFGKIVGDTIYNLTRYNEVDTDPETDRPYEPPRIISVEVLANPFEDIVPRRKPAAQVAREQEEQARKQEAAAAAKARASGAGKSKNLALLSFGEQAEEEEEAEAVQPAKRIRAAHDVIKDGRLVQEHELTEEEKQQLAEEEAARAAALEHTRAILAKRAAAQDKEGVTDEGDDAGKEVSFAERMRARIRDKQTHLVGEPAAQAKAQGENRPENEGTQEEDEEEDEEQEAAGGGRSRGRSGGDVREQRNQELEDIRRNKRAIGKMQALAGNEVADADLLKPWHVNRQRYKQRKEAIGHREKDTLARLAAFTNKLQSAPGTEAPAQQDEPAAAPVSAADQQGYAGKVRDDIDHKLYMPAAWRVDDYLEGDFQDTKLEDLKAHKLAFAKGVGDHMARKDNVDDYVVYDPLLEEAKGKSKFSKAAQKEKKKQNQWAGKSNS